MAVKKARNKDRTVTFEVRTEQPLPVGEQVFISGNQDMLGQWKADGFPLTRMADLVWTGSAILPGDERIEFKITRGSWDTEEINANGTVIANSVLKPGGDTAVRRTVAAWKDKA
jgi:hypothetical protein